MKLSDGVEWGVHACVLLAVLPADVTVLDVVEAIDGEEPAFRCTEIRRRGPTALPAREYRFPCGIHRVFNRADEAWRAELAATTIADLVVGVMQQAPRPAVEKGARWLSEAVR